MTARDWDKAIRARLPSLTRALVAAAASALSLGCAQTGQGQGGASMPVLGGRMTPIAPALNLVPSGINSAGIVVGASGQAAFTRSAEGVVQTWDLPGTSITRVSGIDDAGNIAGYALAPGSQSSWGFVRSSDGHDTHVYSLDPRAPGGAVTLAGMATSGLMVGTHGATSRRKPVYMGRLGAFTRQAVLEFPSGFAEVYGVNARGVIVGTWSVNPGQSAVGFTIVNGRIQQFSVPGAQRTLALGINDRGDIVGGFAIGTGTPWRCFMRSASGAFSEIVETGGFNCQARAISNDGKVAGISGRLDYPKAFLFTP